MFDLIVMVGIFFGKMHCAEFEILETTLPGRSVDYWMNFGIGEYDGRLTTVDLLSYFISSEFNVGDTWTENTGITIPFNADRLRFYSQSSIQSNNLLYGVPWIRSTDGGSYVYHEGSNLVKYDFTKNQFIDINSYNSFLLTPTTSGCITITDNKLHFIGGTNTAPYPYSAIDTTQVYDIITDIWEYKTSLNTARGYAGCSINSNHENIYIFGGITAQYGGIALNSIEKYTVNTQQWTMLDTTLTTARYGHKCIYIDNNNLIYCIGGQYDDDPNHYLSSIEIFDPLNGVMIPTDIILNVARSSFGMIMITNNLLIFGGHGVDVYPGGTSYMLDSIERLEIITPHPTVHPTVPPTSSPSTNERIPCDSTTDISQLGNILCHYSSVFGDGYNQNTNTWLDMTGNGNDMDGTNMVDISGVYLGNDFWVQNNNNGDGYGYIIFPEGCNLPSDGYTLFTASMYYGPHPIGARAFGNCDDNSFVSGWYEPKEPEDTHDQNIYVRRPRGPYSYTLAHDKYVTNDISRWVIASDTMNSFRMNGAEITHEIPMINTLGNDVQICFNYVDGSTTNGAYRIKEYIVFGEELSNENRRCVEEYIFDRNPSWQMLYDLAPFRQ